MLATCVRGIVIIVTRVTGISGVQTNGSRPDADSAVCATCGAAIPLGSTQCPSCNPPAIVLDVRRAPTERLPLKKLELTPQFDRLLVLAALLAFLSLYLPWLPGLYGSVPGWKVPYSTPDIPLDEIRHLEEVAKPDSLFLINCVGLLALLFCRTSRHAGVRDLVASVILTVGGGYFLIYFAHEWGWCLRYSYVGPYAAFMSLGLIIGAGLWRTKYMPWVEPSKVLLLVASAFLLTGLFLPWSLDTNGLALMFIASSFNWLGVPCAFAYLMSVFPALGFVSFVMAFRESGSRLRAPWHCWAMCFGLASLVYFRVMWSAYLVGWPLGTWGVLLGLTALTVAGFLDAFPDKPLFARAITWVFVLVSVAAWISFLTGDFWGGVRDFFGPPPRFF